MCTSSTTTHLLKCHKLLGLGLLSTLLLALLLLALLELHLHVGQSGSIESAVCNAAMLESTTIVAGTIVVVALANDLATANDDTAMAVV